MPLYEKWSTFYDNIYKRINYEDECNTILKILKEKLDINPTSILDIACGTGSHSIIFAKLGIEVTGVDISEDMLKIARAKAQRENLQITFTTQDMRTMSFDNIYDCAICMFTAFPYNTTIQDIEQTLASIKKHLKKGGAFIFDFANIGGLRPTPNTHWERVEHDVGTLYRLSFNSFNAESNIVEMGFRFIDLRRDGSYESFDEIHRLRLFTFPEISQILTQNGFEVLGDYNWDQNKNELKALTRENWRILVVSRTMK
jgi:ubiquinone/menaquinone biosynthesis C-methylase UbiE